MRTRRDREPISRIKAACDELAFDIGYTIASAVMLREALQMLYDVQNGPPLISQEDEWREAMSRACEALKYADTGRKEKP